MAYTNYNAAAKNSGILQELRTCGYNVENRNGQYYVKIENISVPIYPKDDIFTLKNRFLELKQQEIRKENSARFDKEIEKGKENVAKFSSMFDMWMAALKQERHNLISFLSSNGVSYLSQLKNDKQKYEQGVAIQDAKYNAAQMKNRALAGLVSAAHDTQSACCHKIMYTC